VRALNAVSNWILRRFGVDPNADFEEGGSPEELRRLIAESGAAGTLPLTQSEMLGGIFHLEEQQARHVMTPAPSVTMVSADATAADAARTCIESGHTRLVVREAAGPGIEGVLHANDILSLLVSQSAEAPITSVVKEPLLVPETRALPELLRELRGAHASLAIVVDEYGRTAGVVSVEDVLEEIVGEIADETDPDETVLRTVGDGEWVADGAVSLADLSSHGIEIEADSDVFTSLGGLVLHLAGRVPEEGDEFESSGYRLIAERVASNRVAAVRVIRTG
jgi:CBS domain containing-hemolysin-like protein